MFDEMDQLRSVTSLRDLLVHYGQLGKDDRQVWRDRLMDMEGLEVRDLTRLHGELLAFGWLEQNTGLTPVLAPSGAPSCYRITSAGVRALRQLRAEAKDEAKEVSQTSG